MYCNYCELKEKAGEKLEVLNISDNWLCRRWKEYRVSLKHPNNRFNVSNDVRKRRINQLLKNIRRARYWYLKKYKVDPFYRQTRCRSIVRSHHDKKLSILKVESSPAFLRKSTTYSVKDAPLWQLYHCQKNSIIICL